MRLRDALAGMLWLVLVLAGFAWLTEFAATPASGRSEPRGEPSSDLLAGTVPTLLVFMHPKCPCTGATLDELERLLARAGSRVACRVVLLEDEAIGGVHEGWRRRAESIPGVVVVDDLKGAIARSFGVATSGHCLLLRGGELLFDGGITPGRGHAGDNLGSRGILEHILGLGVEIGSAPVFGCPLTDASEEKRK